MKTSLLYLSAIGILSVTIAASIYTWQQIDAYRLQKKAEQVCQTRMADYEEEDERWVMVRRCMNDILGDRRSQDQSTEIESLQSRISDLATSPERVARSCTATWELMKIIEPQQRWPKAIGIAPSISPAWR